MINPLLEVHNLNKIFYYRTVFFKLHALKAIKSMTFSLEEQQTLAIIGENGSGKSSLVKVLVGMIKPTSGTILLDSKPLVFGDYHYRSQFIRMIPQNAETSLNPAQTIGKILELPLKIHTQLTPQERENRIYQTLRQVGLISEHAFYYPHMLTIGQKQRVAIANAVILRPKIIIIDETLNALDMTVRSQIINLMLNLQKTLDMSYIYVTQHLGLAKHISDKVLVIQKGEIVERGCTAEVFTAPLHPLTERLVVNHFGEIPSPNIWRNDIRR